MSSEDQVQQQIAQFLENINKGTEFAVDNAPVIVEQFITKSLLYHGVWGILFTLAACLCALFVFCAVKDCRESSDGKKAKDAAAGGLGFSLFFLLSIAGVVVNAFYIVYALLFPELFVLNYLPSEIMR